MWLVAWLKGFCVDSVDWIFFKKWSAKQKYCHREKIKRSKETP